MPFFQKQIGRIRLEVSLKESKKIFDSEKFLHNAVLSVPKRPELVVVHLLSGHLFDFSPLCGFQMCPQIACH